MFGNRYGTHYSISADSRRWWWPSTAAGVAALTAAVAIPVAAGNTTPADNPLVSAGADDVSGGVPTVGSGGQPCSMSGAGRNVVVSVPQPPCEAARAERRSKRPAHCPPPPDYRYVGVPWVPYEPTGCKSIDRWWTMANTQNER